MVETQAPKKHCSAADEEPKYKCGVCVELKAECFRAAGLPPLTAAVSPPAFCKAASAFATCTSSAVLANQNEVSFDGRS